MKKNEKKTLLIATHNKAKLAEITKILADSPYKVISLADLGITHEVEETGSTLVENALIKAKEYCDMTGYTTLADDSGLEIAALNGEPGVYTKDYAGKNVTEDQKRAFILNKMLDVPLEKRQACFKSVIAVAQPSGYIEWFEGKLDGLIALEAHGPHIPQFPYCSIFLVPAYGKTLNQLLLEDHNIDRHRTIAIQKALASLKDA